MKNEATRFDATGVEMTQHTATSLDGTLVPYFEVARKTKGGAKPRPTLLYGYGGVRALLYACFGPRREEKPRKGRNCVLWSSVWFG